MSKKSTEIRKDESEKTSPKVEYSEKAATETRKEKPVEADSQEGFDDEEDGYCIGHWDDCDECKVCDIEEECKTITTDSEITTDEKE